MKRLALLGMPNTGKSTLYNRLSGSHAKVGNWPGITVDLLTARVMVGGNLVQLVDLPGIYDLGAYSEDEAVVTGFLAGHPCDGLVMVVNASQIERQLRLLQQLLEHAATKNVPMLLVLNMADEAAKLGIEIDTRHLADLLGLPVCLLSAKYGQGTEQLQQQLRTLLEQGEMQLAARRALPALSHDRLQAILEEAVVVPATATHALTDRIDHVLLHPWLGLPLFFGVMFLLFQAVFMLGKPIQDGMNWLFGQTRSLLLEPALAWAPHLLQGLLLDGVWSGVSTVASFVPIIVLFFLFLGLVEDTGYLARAAFLMDALMARFGMDGRSFVMVLMGFGCNVPALMGTRTMRSRGLRWLTMAVIPMSLCSARLQVFLFMIPALFTPRQAPLVLFSLYVLSILATMVTALAFKPGLASSEPFVLEMPPYRWPTLHQMLQHAWREVHHFLRRATRFIILGVLLVWVLTNLPPSATVAGPQTLAGYVGALLEPVMRPLGIVPELTISLIFGLVAKEIVVGSLSVIYAREGAALASTIASQIDWVQAYSFMLFTLIYVPCLSTIATIRNETRSLRFTVMTVIWSLTLAWCISFIFYQVTRWLL